MSLEFFQGKILALIKTLEGYYELSGITIAEKQENEMKFITSYPESWMYQYYSQRYYENDLVHELGLSAQSNYFFWGSQLYVHSTEIQQVVFEEACKYEIQSGLTFNFPEDSSHKMISIAFPYSDEISSKLSQGIIEELRANVYTLRILMQLSTYNNFQSEYLDHLTLRSKKHLFEAHSFNTVVKLLENTLMQMKGFLKCLPIALRPQGEVLVSLVEEEVDSWKKTEANSG